MRLPLQNALDGVPVESAMFRNWNALNDDELLARAHEAGFTVLLTTNKRLAQEQSPLTLAVIALDDNRWSTLLRTVDRIATAVKAIGMAEHQTLRLRK